MLTGKPRANIENLNAAYVSRTTDTTTAGKVRLEKQGLTAVDSVQQSILEIFDVEGVTEGDATSKNYSSTNYIANGDSRKAAIGKLDAALATHAGETNPHGLTANDIGAVGTSGDQSVAGAKTFDDTVKMSGELVVAQSDDTTTGEIAALVSTGISALRMTGAGAVTIHGIADGVAGKILTLSNVTGQTLVVTDQNATALATDRIITGAAGDIELADGAAIVLQYDGTATRWRVIGGTGGSGNGPLTISNILSLTPTVDSRTGLLAVVDLTACAHIRFTGASAVTVQGIAGDIEDVVNYGGVAGQIALLTNATGVQLVIAHESSAAFAPHRFFSPTGKNIKVESGGAILLTYDRTSLRWRMVGGMGGTGGGALNVTGSRSTPQAITAAGGIAYVVNEDFPRQLWFIQGDGAAIDVIAIPQIEIGSVVGQELVIVGCSDDYPVTLHDGNGLSLNGSFDLFSGSVLTLVWEGSLWCEVSRR